MSTQLRDLEKNPDVAALLQELLSRAQVILDDQFVGLYLYGSLATGDFNPYRSDVDFVVVTASKLSPEIVAELESMHLQLGSSGMPWASKLEGAYVPKEALRRHTPDLGAFPTINEGRFYLARLGSDWIIQRYILREYEATMAGPPTREFIDPIHDDELRDSVRMGFREWWEPMVDDPARLERPEYQPFAVLSMCRALYTVSQGELDSKGDAAAWAMKELESEWKELIGEAASWKRGDPLGSISRTVEFIRYVGGRINESR